MIGEPWHVPARSSGLTFDEVAGFVERLRAGEQVRILGTLVEAVRDDPPPLPRPLAVGDVLEGFCGGVFGRDSYEDKTVEVIGRDFVIARSDSGPRFCEGDPAELVEYRRRR